MTCTTCDAPLVPDRLFCVSCGSVTPEGHRVMNAERSALAPPAIVEARVGARTIAVAPSSNSAVASLLFGILSYVAIPFVGALIAIIFGHHARREIRVSGHRLGGLSMANAGLVLGYAQIAALAFLVMAAFLIILFAIAAAA